MRILLAFAVMIGPAFADDCPDPADISAEMSELIAQANAAPDQQAGRVVSDQMWQVWTKAPNAQAQAVLKRGMGKRDVYDFIGAYADFDRLVNYCPTYAEGWNQRAYVQFLQGQFDSALADLDQALTLSPDHVAAQSGRALTLMQMGRMDEARAQMLEALDNNPWLSERALVAKGAPLGPKGEDI